MPDFLKNITETSYSLLKNILEQPGCVPADFFFDDPTVDGHVELLKAYDLITMDENEGLNITELGRAVLVEYEQLAKQKRIAEKQRQEELDSIKSIADSAKGQAETAKMQARAANDQAEAAKMQAKAANDQAETARKQAEAAKKDAKFSRITSIIAIIISVIAIIVQVAF